MKMAHCCVLGIGLQNILVVCSTDTHKTIRAYLHLDALISGLIVTSLDGTAMLITCMVLVVTIAENLS